MKRERERDRGRALEQELSVWSTGVIGMRDMSSVFPTLTEKNQVLALGFISKNLLYRLVFL